MILAAGKGKRMWPLTDNTPKPLLPLGGTTIIQRQIEELTKIGVKEIHVLIGYQMKEISNHLGNGEKLGVKIKYIIQESSYSSGTDCKVKMAQNFRIPGHVPISQGWTLRP